jgi:tRNA(fMet)-specific endonuclease VapC
MTHLLDTDTCINILRQRPGYIARLNQLAPNDCAVSMITVYELFCGIENAQNPAAERIKVERFITTIHQLPLDRVSAETAARIRVELERQGMVIGPYDLLIAGHSLAHDLTLVSNNTQEFGRVQRLKLESWP